MTSYAQAEEMTQSMEKQATTPSTVARATTPSEATKGQMSSTPAKAATPWKAPQSKTQSSDNPPGRLLNHTSSPWELNRLWRGQSIHDIKYWKTVSLQG